MGSKKKLVKFAENLTFKHLFQPTYDEVKDNFSMKGKWNHEFFKNDNPIVLELACGKGEYTVGLAEKYPDKNFIGIDYKGARLWRGAKTSHESKMNNVAFVRTKIQLINKIFAKNEVDEIWITFPDPQPKKTNKRLTSTKFLSKYSKIIKMDGLFHLKTDSLLLFDYTLEVIEQANHNLVEAIKDLYNNADFDEVKSIKTHYEKLFSEQGFSINYLKFSLNPLMYTDEK